MMMICTPYYWYAAGVDRYLVVRCLTALTAYLTN